MLSLVLGLSLTHAAGLPSIDEALKTGASAPADTAVVIGVEDYAFVQDVPYAQRDANAFYDFLVYTRGVPSGRVRLLDQGASKEQILEAVTTAGDSVGAGGTVWVYFAGHGAADPSDGGRMLLGDDVRQDPTAFAARAVPVSEIKTLATAKGGAVNLVVDACYSGLGRSGDELVAGKRFLVPAYATAAKPGNLEWSAASGEQLSGPLHPVRHGAFTYLAIGALRGWADGQVDGTPNGEVTAEEAQLYVKSALRSLQITDQTPELSVDNATARVLVSSNKLESAPTLDARMAAGGAPTTGPAPTTKPTGAIDAHDRPAVESYVRGAVEQCVAEHAGGDPLFNRWSIRFKIKSGGVLKGYMANLGEFTESPALWPTMSCVREQVKSWQFTANSTVTFRTAITLETRATAPQPVPAITTTQPASTANSEPSTLTVNLPNMTLNGGSLTTATPTPAPATAASGGVTLILRSQDGEWVDVRVDGEVVAEIRNDDEERVTITPGVHTVEFIDFMADDPYASGRLDTAGLSEIIFGVRETGVELYGNGSWSSR
ncbi:MAG: caspase family protein [Proteobacteria bacterium]|nr:caspase family protein [Pseudomonadota bacterium]